MQICKAISILIWKCRSEISAEACKVCSHRDHQVTVDVTGQTFEVWTTVYNSLVYRPAYGQYFMSLVHGQCWNEI